MSNITRYIVRSTSVDSLVVSNAESFVGSVRGAFDTQAEAVEWVKEKWYHDKEVCAIWVEEFIDYLDIVGEQNSKVETMKEELESAFEAFKDDPSPPNRRDLEVLTYDYTGAWYELQEMEAALTVGWTDRGSNDCTKGNPDFVNAGGE